jgi:hypothetical protein
VMSVTTDNVACPTKQVRRKKTEMADLRAVIVASLKADHPMTVRQVFYQLVVRGAVEKTEGEYSRTVVRLLTDMGMDGEIPFSWISDESRSRTTLRSFDNVSDALDDTAKFYRRNAMRECPAYFDVWSEKQALAGIIWDEAGEYGVPVVVSKGMPSITQLYQTASLVRRAARASKPTYIYQFGDHDPSGVLIPQTIQKRLGQMCGKLDCPPPHFERAALTPEHIEEFNLPTRPTKRDGNTHAYDFEGESVELDALPATELRTMVREVIGRHISDEALEALQVAEASERSLLKMWARDLRNDQEEDDAAKVRRMFGDKDDDAP